MPKVSKPSKIPVREGATPKDKKGSKIPSRKGAPKEAKPSKIQPRRNLAASAAIEPLPPVELISARNDREHVEKGKRIKAIPLKPPKVKKPTTDEERFLVKYELAFARRKPNALSNALHALRNSTWVDAKKLLPQWKRVRSLLLDLQVQAEKSEGAMSVLVALNPKVMRTLVSLGVRKAEDIADLLASLDGVYKGWIDGWTVELAVLTKKAGETYSWPFSKVQTFLTQVEAHMKADPSKRA